MRITIREEAADDLEAAFAWIAKDNPMAATDQVHRIRDRIARLATPGLSHMGRLGTVAGTRELVEEPFIIVYTADDRAKEIVVLAIMHARLDRH